jgi:hypothetical protein
MTVLFPGPPMSVVGMAAAMEGAKLVTGMACEAMARDGRGLGGAYAFAR